MFYRDSTYLDSVAFPGLRYLIGLPDKPGFFRCSGRKGIQNVEPWFIDIQRTWTLLPPQAACHFISLACSVQGSWSFGTHGYQRVGLYWFEARHSWSMVPSLWLFIGFSCISIFHFILALPRGNLRRKGTAFVSYSAEPLSHLQGPALVCEHGQQSWKESQ